MGVFGRDRGTHAGTTRWTVEKGPARPKGSLGQPKTQQEKLHPGGKPAKGNKS